MSRERKYRYSEIFGETFQGEGTHTGKNSVWVRFFGCNKTCYLFGQDKNNIIPKKEMYYEKLDPITIKTLDDAPIEPIGCDTWTAWHPKFKHLAIEATASEIAQRIVDTNKNEYNPLGLFMHPKSHQDIHLCFTGGESMMNQSGIVDVIQVLIASGNYPRNITIETNGTVPIKKDVKAAIQKLTTYGIVVLWSVSPKLESVSGEKWQDSILPEVVNEYPSLLNLSLKFVCDNTPECWDEVEKAIDAYRAVGLFFNVWIMPEGATKDAQDRHSAAIAIEAMKRGYYFSARVHAIVFGACPGK